MRRKPDLPLGQILDGDGGILDHLARLRVAFDIRHQALARARDDAEAAMNDLALAVNNQRKLITKRDAAVVRVSRVSRVLSVPSEERVHHAEASAGFSERMKLAKLLTE